MTLTRRTAWSGALAGTALLAGCDLTAEEDPAAGSTPATANDEPDADADLVAAAVEDVTTTMLLVVGTRDRHPRLRRDLGGLERMHDEHLAALGSTDQSAQDPSVPPDAGSALRQLRRRELAHQRQLVDHAVAARSGQLAGLLASMSAAVAQQLALLPAKADR